MYGSETSLEKDQFGTVVLGVVGNDIHVVANRILVICLEAAGIRVVNIGVNNRPEDFADTALEVSADIVLIGSLNGEATHWCHGIRALFECRGIGDTLIYLGGNLATGSLSSDKVEESFYKSGIDRVFHGAVDFDTIISLVKEDLISGDSVSRRKVD